MVDEWDRQPLSKKVEIKATLKTSWHNKDSRDLEE